MLTPPHRPEYMGWFIVHVQMAGNTTYQLLSRRLGFGDLCPMRLRELGEPGSLGLMLECIVVFGHAANSSID
jgi:hypothetical protein